jgi:chromosome segregation ATPase
MIMRIIRNIILLLLASSLIFLTYRYISYLKTNISNLESEKTSLLQQLDSQKAVIGKLKDRNASLKNYLRAADRRLGKSFVDLNEAKLENEQLKSQFSLLKAENSALLEEKASYTQENESMKVKLSSVDELKKAIKELKNRGKQHRAVQSDGNRGFLVKDGQPTSVPKVKIEVTPVSDNNNERNNSPAS